MRGTDYRGTQCPGAGVMMLDSGASKSARRDPTDVLGGPDPPGREDVLAGADRAGHQYELGQPDQAGREDVLTDRNS